MLEKKLEKQPKTTEIEMKEVKSEPEIKPEPDPELEAESKPKEEPKTEPEAEAKPEAQPITEQPKEPQARKRRTTKEEPQEKVQPEEPLPGQLSFGGLQVVLNGAPLRLEAKQGGGDYYLMDLLERSGLDFSKLDRPVELLVNGAEGQFSQVLRANDQVTIRYRDE